MSISPAFPPPLVLAETSAPSVREREPVLIMIPCESPSAVASTVLKMPLGARLLSPNRIIVSFAVILISPAFPTPKVLAPNCAPSAREREAVLIVIPSAIPLASGCTVLEIPLPSPSLSSPERVILCFAKIEIVRASPTPKVLALTNAPLMRESEPVSIVMPPEFPVAFSPTWLKIPLTNPRLDSPERIMASVATIFMAPASPTPNVLALSLAPPERERESVLILIPSEFPVVPDWIWLMMPLNNPSVLSPDIVIVSLALIVMASAFSCAPSVRERKLVSMVISPPAPWAPDATWLLILLPNPCLSSPERVIESVAVIFMAPASPTPKVLALSSAPSVREREPVLIVMSPEFPSPPISTLLKITLSSPSLFSPERVMASVAAIFMAPASPNPEVLALTCAPSVREREPVSMLMPPELPLAPSTSLKMPLTFSRNSPERVTDFGAAIFMTPLSPTPKVLVLSFAPSIRERELVSMVMSPAFPSAPAPTSLKMLLTFKFPRLESPEREISRVAEIAIAAPFPTPKVLLLILAPSIRERELLSMVIPPEFPSA